MNKTSAEQIQIVKTGSSITSDYTDRNGIANHLKVSPRHIQNLQRRRIIPYNKLGRCIRFRISEVEAALKACEVKSIGQF